MTLTEELLHRTRRAHEVASSALRAYAAEMIEDGDRKRPRFSPQTTEAITSLLALMFKIEGVWGENAIAGKAVDVAMDYFVAAAEAFGLRECFVNDHLWYRIRLSDCRVLELKEQFEKLAV